VGGGVGFAGEAEACWPGAVPPLETKARIISKTIRITGCMERKRGSERAAHSVLRLELLPRALPHHGRAHRLIHFTSKTFIFRHNVKPYFNQS